MKKLLLSVCLYFLYFGNVYANLIELEKCFRSDNWWNYTKVGTDQEFPEANNVEWTEENYLRDNSLIKISKDKFLKNLKKLDLDYQYGVKQTQIYPRIPYITLKTADYSKKEIEKFKSIGGKVINKYDRKVYSINTESSILTKMEIMSEEFYNHIIAMRSETLNGQNTQYKCDERCKKSIKDFLNELEIRGKVKTTQLAITSYAGGILVAEKKFLKFVVDFNTSIITERLYKSNKTYKCPTDFVEANEGDSPKGSSGTAFFINSKGYLLTNNHVVEGCKLSKISYKNKDVDAKLIATDKTLDLALLKVKVRPKSFISFSKDEPKKLNEIFVAGYPLGKGLSDDLKISSGIISSLKGFEDNSNEIQIDAPINPGNSGGPIINKNGSLVGIAVSGMAKDQTEGINFGIKASAAESFLKSNQINPIKSLNSKRKDNDQLLNILEEGTVYTYCE